MPYENIVGVAVKWHGDLASFYIVALGLEVDQISSRISAPTICSVRPGKTKTKNTTLSKVR